MGISVAIAPGGQVNLVRTFGCVLAAGYPERLTLIGEDLESTSTLAACMISDLEPIGK